MSRELRLAMLGMIPGNGHPYSWAAIINGYDPGAMASCPYPTIPKYLGAQPHESVRIPGARVTHLWTENPEEARHVARASRIETVVSTPEAVIGEVDAVVITTDDGADHARRARPFIEAGLPVFIDKPLATTRGELAQFTAWHQGGARLLSSSSLRYAPGLAKLQGQPWHWLTATSTNTWERYGIHLLEPLFTLLGPGFESVYADGAHQTTTLSLTHRSGAKAAIAVLPEAPACFGMIHAYGPQGHQSVNVYADPYTAFRGQMLALIQWVRSGQAPYPFEHTLELMQILIAGLESRERGCPVPVSSIQ